MHRKNTSTAHRNARYCKWAEAYRFFIGSYVYILIYFLFQYETVTNISSHKPRLNHDRNEPWEINQDNGLNLFEGDIINHPIIHQSNTRNAVNNDDDLWRNGEIPYFIEGAYSKSGYNAKVVC